MSRRIAEALVECGYADDINEDHIAIAHQCGEYGEDVDWEFRPVEWDQDTLEGRRQADALEDWLVFDNARANLWIKSFAALDDPTCGTGQTHRQWRLDRIKWCFEQLEAQSDE